MPRKRTLRPVTDRVWDKVLINDGCWLSAGAKSDHGYPLISVGPAGSQRMKRMSRVVWEALHGPIPTGLHVCHTCDNPGCVRPSHLWLGTPSDNMRDAVRKGRHRSGWPKRRGETHARAKVTEAQVVEMRRRYSDGGVTQAELGRDYGLTQAIVSAIVTRRLWRHLP